MNSKIKWRLTITYLALIFVTMTCLGFILSYSIEHQFTSEVRTALNAHGQLLRSQIEGSPRKFSKPGDLDNACRLMASKINAHVVVRGKDGVVLGDSERGFRSTVDIPESMKGLREGFGCRICHSEVRDPKMLSVIVPIKPGNPRDGSVIVSASLYEATRAAARARRIILAMLIFTSLLVAVMTFRLAGSIADPVSHMNEMARKMASGDLSLRVQVVRMDEIGQLAESLNVMADHLQSNLDQLAQERDKMATVLTTMADGIVITDKSGTITLFNRASERLFGLKAGKVVGSRVDVLKSIPDMPEIIRRTLDGGAIARQEIPTTAPAERIVNAYASPVHDQKGAIAGCVVVLQDVTEIRRQAEIRKDFVANVSHELRTPVASVRAIVGALQSGAIEESSVAQKFLDNLDLETDRLSLLLNDLLNLSELDAGKKGKQTTVDLLEITEQVVSELAEKARKGSIKVRVDIPRELSVIAGKHQMVQVMCNLVDNAIKYNSEGGRVDILGSQTESEIMITVRDTGVGIPPSDLDRIFERFYRVDKARSRQLGGTGLGLSIVKDIVEAHDGRIMADSKVGVGSSFTIALPKGKPDTPAS
jgi:two-component system phosphate regulon sensor histidine kinase PhoR